MKIIELVVMLTGKPVMLSPILKESGLKFGYKKISTMITAGEDIKPEETEKLLNAIWFGDSEPTTKLKDKLVELRKAVVALDKLLPFKTCIPELSFGASPVVNEKTGEIIDNTFDENEDAEMRRLLGPVVEDKEYTEFVDPMAEDDGIPDDLNDLDDFLGSFGDDEDSTKDVVEDDDDPLAGLMDEEEKKEEDDDDFDLLFQTGSEKEADRREKKSRDVLDDILGISDNSEQPRRMTAGSDDFELSSHIKDEFDSENAQV